MIVSFVVNYLLLSLWSPFVLLLAAFFLPPDTLRSLDQSPGWENWFLTVLVLVPGLLMQFPLFQRMMIFTSGWQKARGTYLEVLEQALEPVIRRGGLEGEKFHLYINPEKSLNACALGDNNIIVNAPMFQYFTVDELSGILAHEMGHLQKGHTWKLLLLCGMSTANRACFRLYRLFLAFLTVLQFIPLLGFILVFFCMVMNFILQVGNWLLGWPLTLFNRYWPGRMNMLPMLMPASWGWEQSCTTVWPNWTTCITIPSWDFSGRCFPTIRPRGTGLRGYGSRSISERGCCTWRATPSFFQKTVDMYIRKVL